MPVITARRVLALSAVAIVTAGVAIIAASFIPEAVYWHHHRDIRLYSAAKEASAQLEHFKARNGRYPSAVDESSQLGQAIARTAHQCEQLGYAVAAIEMTPVNESDHRRGDEQVLVLWSTDGRQLVVLFRDASIGVNRRLVTRQESQVPSWIRVID